MGLGRFESGNGLLSIPFGRLAATLELLQTPPAIEVRTVSTHPETLPMGNAQHFPAGGAVIKKPHTQPRLDPSGGLADRAMAVAATVINGVGAVAMLALPPILAQGRVRHTWMLHAARRCSAVTSLLWR